MIPFRLSNSAATPGDNQPQLTLSFCEERENRKSQTAWPDSPECTNFGQLRLDLFFPAIFKAV
jgi:hypothetical protein